MQTRFDQQTDDLFRRDARKSARRLLAAARDRATQLFSRATSFVRQHFADGAEIAIGRFRMKSGSFDLHDTVRIGPNHFHAWIAHPDGTITDCGVSKNLLTNIGNSVMQGAYGGAIPAGGAGSPATACTSTSITATSTPWTASNLSTPQLGLAGFRVYASVTGVGTAPVYGNIVSNTTSVATIDKWWTAADGTGTTPASTNAFIIGAGGLASMRFVALTTNSSAAAYTDTALASEITTNGCGRALGTFARGTPSAGTGTYTISNTFNVTGLETSISKGGTFFCLTSAGADPIGFETLLNTPATVNNGDTLNTTWSVQLSG
jgi:hypothetical protein